MGYMCDDYRRDRDRDYTSKAQGNLNTVLSIIGAAGAVGGENGGLPFLNGGGNKMAELRAENAALKAEKYADGTTQALYNKVVADNKELSGYLCAERNRITALEGQISTDKAQAEVERLKAQIESERAMHALKAETDRRLCALEASVPLVQERLMGAIAAEREARECGDNAIVNYTNATFYPKMVADVTTGTTTTAQVTYNPLPCQCLKRCA